MFDFKHEPDMRRLILDPVTGTVVKTDDDHDGDDDRRDHDR
jgi:hypothetical protein